MRIIILYNPAAGRGRARRKFQTAREVLRRGGDELEVYESRSTEHLRELAREAAAAKPDMIVSAGGDGTHHQVINEAWLSGVPIATLPLGSGDDLPRALSMPAQPQEAARALLAGKLRQIDLVKTGPRVFAGLAGVGFVAVANRFANERVHRMWGRLSYPWAILHTLLSYRPQPLELHSEDRAFAGDILLVVVGNGGLYGGGFQLAPHAQLDDGLLDVCIVPPLGFGEILRWAPRAYRGTHLAHPRVQYFQSPRVTLRSSVRMELYADGEFIQELPATMEVMPRALKVVVPA